MATDKTERQNRVREALGRLYEQQPPYFREYLRRFQEIPLSRVFAPLAEAYRRLGRLEEAIEICQEGLTHHPDFHGGRVALAKCYIDKRLFSEARAELERVVQSVPENLMAQRLLGDVYLALRDSVSALHCYKMALLLSPNDVALAEKVHQLEKDGPVLSDFSENEFDDEVAADERLPSEVEAELSEIGEDDTDLPPLWNSQAAAKEGEQPEALAEDLEKALSETLAEQAYDLTEGSSVTNPEVELETFLGNTSIDDEAFKIEHVSAIFGEEAPSKEITTETLGDLYFSQGQFDRALRIFEKLRPTPDIARKIDQCRTRLGVDQQTHDRSKKISLLRDVLKRAQQARSS